MYTALALYRLPHGVSWCVADSPEKWKSVLSYEPCSMGRTYFTWCSMMQHYCEVTDLWIPGLTCGWHGKQEYVLWNAVSVPLLQFARYCCVVMVT